MEQKIFIWCIRWECDRDGFNAISSWKTICVSSQIGCKMGCKFCASTGINFVRNLTAGEIVEQIVAVEQDIGEEISNIVFMGIGEPLDNLTM